MSRQINIAFNGVFWGRLELPNEPDISVLMKLKYLQALFPPEFELTLQKVETYSTSEGSLYGKGTKEFLT